MPSLDIVQRMIQVVPAITGLIDRLEKAGMVRRERSDVDRRVVNVEITQLGLQALDRLDAPVLELHQKLLGHLKPSELKELNRLLEAARQGPTSGE